MLLLLDFFRVAPAALETSSVAFSLSSALLRVVAVPPPMDLRVRRVAGSVASPVVAILTAWSLPVVWMGCRRRARNDIAYSGLGGRDGDKDLDGSRVATGVGCWLRCVTLHWRGTPVYNDSARLHWPGTLE